MHQLRDLVHIQTLMFGQEQNDLLPRGVTQSVKRLSQARKVLATSSRVQFLDFAIDDMLIGRIRSTDDSRAITVMQASKNYPGLEKNDCRTGNAEVDAVASRSTIKEALQLSKAPDRSIKCLLVQTC